MLLWETIKWLAASLTWKGVGFENEHPCFLHPDERTVTQISNQHPQLGLFTEDNASLCQRCQSDGETQPLFQGAPCLKQDVHLLLQGSALPDSKGQSLPERP